MYRKCVLVWVGKSVEHIVSVLCMTCVSGGGSVPQPGVCADQECVLTRSVC